MRSCLFTIRVPIGLRFTFRFRTIFRSSGVKNTLQGVFAHYALQTPQTMNPLLLLVNELFTCHWLPRQINMPFCFGNHIQPTINQPPKTRENLQKAWFQPLKIRDSNLLPPSKTNVSSRAPGWDPNSSWCWLNHPSIHPNIESDLKKRPAIFWWCDPRGLFSSGFFGGTRFVWWLDIHILLWKNALFLFRK